MTTTSTPTTPPWNRWGSYTASLWITIEDQEGNELARTDVPYDIGSAYWSVARLEWGDLTLPLHAVIVTRSGEIDAGVTSITCHVYGELDPLPTLGSSEGSATRP